MYADSQGPQRKYLKYMQLRAAVHVKRGTTGKVLNKAKASDLHHHHHHHH